MLLAFRETLFPVLFWYSLTLYKTFNDLTIFTLWNDLLDMSGNGYDCDSELILRVGEDCDWGRSGMEERGLTSSEIKWAYYTSCQDKRLTSEMSMGTFWRSLNWVCGIFGGHCFKASKPPTFLVRFQDLCVDGAFNDILISVTKINILQQWCFQIVFMASLFVSIKNKRPKRKVFNVVVIKWMQIFSYNRCFGDNGHKNCKKFWQTSYFIGCL